MYETLCIAFIAMGVIGSISSFIFLKVKKRLNEKGFVYGILGSLVMMILSNLVIGGEGMWYTCFNALFMALLFFNMSNFFGIRLGNIVEDSNAFISFYTGISIVGNLFTIILVGTGGLLVVSNTYHEALLTALGQDIFDALLGAYQVTISTYGYVLLMTYISAVCVGYFTLKMFTTSITNKTMKPTFKALLCLFSFYIVNLYTPSSTREGIFVVILFIAVTLSSYLLYINSKNDKPSIIVRVE